MHIISHLHRCTNFSHGIQREQSLVQSIELLAQIAKLAQSVQLLAVAEPRIVPIYFLGFSTYIIENVQAHLQLIVDLIE